MRVGWRPSSMAIARLAPALFVLVPTAILVARHGFAGLYGQDAFGYVNYALGPVREALVRLELPPAWPQPPGYPVVLATMSLLVGGDGRIGLLVSLVAGATVPVFTALLAMETVGPLLTGRTRTALPIAAGLIAALPGQLWQSSAVAMSDTLSIAVATAGAWAVCRYARSGGPGWLLGAAAALAFAIDTRWVYGLVAIPVAAVALIGVRRVWRVAPGGRARGTAHVLGATLLGAAVLAPVMGQMGLALLRGTTVPFAADFGAYHWDPLNAVRNAFETTDGRLVYGPSSGWFYLLQPVQLYWFGAVGAFALWGGAWIARHGGTVVATLLIGWPLVVLVFLAGSPYQNPRFFLATMPPIAILIAVGLWRLAAVGDARVPPPRRRLAVIAAASVAVLWLGVATFAAGRHTDAFIDRQTRDLAAIRSLEAMVPADARLISLGPTGVFVYDGVPDVVELYGLTPASALALVDDGRPSYLVIDPIAIRGQWAGRDPALTVEAIRETFGLMPIADAGTWTLYRIGPPA